MISTSLPSKKRKSTENSAVEPCPETLHKKRSPSSRNQKASLKGDVPPLGKFLASNDKTTRDRAVDALRKFLAGGTSTDDMLQNGLFQTKLPLESWDTAESVKHRFDEIELAKLYKGLFYCYWMSDKPIVQQQLAQDLADLCLIIRPSKLPDDPLLAQVSTTQAALTFWKGFWKALELEWQGVDRHRLDKYLLLMRRFVEVSFKILKRVDWHPRSIDHWARILKETVFNVSDPKVPLSITYHFSDTFLDELSRVLQKTPNNPAPILPLLDPLIHALSNARPATATFRRIIDNVFEPLIANLEVFMSGGTKNPTSCTITMYPSFETGLVPTSNPSSESCSPSSLERVRRDVMALLFEAGSNPLCSDSNRRKIYNYWYSKCGSHDEVKSDEAKTIENETLENR